MKYPHIRQHDEKDCGAACLSMISKYYGLKMSLGKFRELIKVDSNGANIYGIVHGAKKIGFDCDALKGNMKDLINEFRNGDIILPIIANINVNNILHYIVIYEINDNYFLIGDPAQDIIKYTYSEFERLWTGSIITFNPNNEFEKFDYTKGSLLKFVNLVTKQSKLLFSIFILSLIISLISICGSLLFKHVIDDIYKFNKPYLNNINNNNLSLESLSTIDKLLYNIELLFSNLNTICFILILFYLIQAGAQILRGYMLAKLSKKINLPLMLGYYDHVIELPSSFFGERKTGEIMSRFDDSSKICESISNAILTLMIDGLLTIVYGIILYKINPLLFSISLIIIIFYVIIILLFKKTIKKININIMNDNSDVTSHLKESIDGIETVKSFNLQNNIKNKTRKLLTKLLDDSIKGTVVYSIQESLVIAIASIGIVLILWFGFNLCISNILTAGTLITFYVLMGSFLNPVKNLVHLQPTIQTAIVASDRLNDFLELEKEKCTGNHNNNLKQDITFSNVNFRYGNRELVINNLNLKIKKGNTIAIIGESGCGKTTLIKLLMGLYKLESGNIKIGDINISEYSLDYLRDKIAYISQDVFLFSESIKNNLLLSNPHASEENILHACKSSLSDKFIFNMPDGLNTILQENGNNLSGGQKQRLAIARAIIKQPDILIMDEATSNLDTITEQSIKNTIETLNKELTVIIIAHRLSTIKNCDNIFVMDKGKIIESGKHDELMNKNGAYFNFWKNQSF